VITPDRISLCGAINWFDGRAAAKVDPEGPQFSIEKGELLDAASGEYSGVNDLAKRLSSGEYDRIKLHSFFEYPHTSCGCFEVVGFYVPEVDGIGWVDRDFAGTAPNGLQFSTMAGQTGGGKQVVGFLGIGVNYFRSPKFISADGGWDRVVWMPSMLKQKVLESIPAELKDKIATDEDVKDVESLKNFLKEKDHPVVKRWVVEEEEHYVWKIIKCPFCWQRKADSSTCLLAVGLLQEVLYWVSGGKFYYVEETDCIARGAQACTITIDKMPMD
jgi:acetyl-CoA decarbonylase/synthase complex subunit beta